MIDIHAHILPAIDDGPETLSESLQMVRVAVEDGIHTIIATPHCLNGVYFNRRQDILSACAEFNRALREHQISLTVLPGSEARLGPEVMGEIENSHLMTLNDTGRYISLELPDQFIPQATASFVNLLKDRNITPVMSHPERNLAVQRNLSLLGDLVSAGALCQVTAGSLIGDFGQNIAKCCRKIIELNIAHFIASDAHSPAARPPILSKASEKLASLIGKTRAHQIMSEHPQALIEGHRI